MAQSPPHVFQLSRAVVLSDDRDLLRRCDVVSHWHLQTGIDAKLMHQHRCWDSDCKASAHGNFILLPNHGLLSLAKEVSGNFGTKNTTRVVLKNASKSLKSVTYSDTRSVRVPCFQAGFATFQQLHRIFGTKRSLVRIQSPRLVVNHAGT